MKITRRQIREAIKELHLMKEDHIDTELDHLKKNVTDDLDHIKDLKDDVKDDHEEEVRAEKEKRKDETLRRRGKKVDYNRLRAMIREEMTQGYDAREDERLGAEHGAESDHEQSYKDRRDDAGFEEHEGSHVEIHHHHEQGYDDREDERLGAEHGGHDEHEQDYKDRRDDAGFEKHHHESLKRKLRRIVKESCGLDSAPEDELEDLGMQMGLEDILAPVEMEMDVDAAPPMEAEAEGTADVPSPEDYASVQAMLSQTPELVDLAIEQVMSMSGATCERSTVMAIIDFLKGMVQPVDSAGAEAIPLEPPFPSLV